MVAASINKTVGQHVLVGTGQRSGQGSYGDITGITSHCPVMLSLLVTSHLYQAGCQVPLLTCGVGMVTKNVGVTDVLQS